MLRSSKLFISLILFIIILLSIHITINPYPIVLADENSLQNIEEEFNNIIQEGLNTLDFSALEDLIINSSSQAQEIFGSTSFYNKLQELINGDIEQDIGSFFNVFLSLFFDNIIDIIPILCMIVAIAILCSLLSNFKSSIGGGGVKDVIHFLCYGVVIIIISALITECVIQVTDTLQSLKVQMEIIFPILLTMITAVGGFTSVSVFQPSVIILSTVIVEIFSYVILPLFIVAFVFTIVNNMSGSTSFNKFVEVAQSSFKWIIGIIFTIFFAFLSINGLIASVYDGIYIRTAKYTMKSYIPYVGGYMSDGLDILLSSSVLIKNAVGTCGLILLIATVLIPLVKMIVVNFGLKITGAILEPISDKRISNFVFSIGKILNMLIACLVSISIMYFLTVGILMSVCNLF